MMEADDDALRELTPDMSSIRSDTSTYDSACLISAALYLEALDGRRFSRFRLWSDWLVGRSNYD